MPHNRNDFSGPHIDNWQHRSAEMCCGTCMHYASMRCRRHAPTLAGWPAVYPTDWCGDHKLDKERMKQLHGFREECEPTWSMFHKPIGGEGSVSEKDLKLDCQPGKEIHIQSHEGIKRVYKKIQPHVKPPTEGEVYEGPPKMSPDYNARKEMREHIAEEQNKPDPEAEPGIFFHRMALKASKCLQCGHEWKVLIAEDAHVRPVFNGGCPECKTKPLGGMENITDGKG